MASNRKWTPQEDGDLLHLTQVGYRADTVAMVLGRTASAVQSRLGQLRRGAEAPPAGRDAALGSAPLMPGAA